MAPKIVSYQASWWLVLLAAAAELVAGFATLGVQQALALRPYVRGARWWIAATAVAWVPVPLVGLGYEAVLSSMVVDIYPEPHTMVNVQDNTVIHGEDGCPTIIGEDVTVGHAAILHAAIVADRVLVGMGAVLLSRCRIGEDTIVGARALVTEEVEIPSGCLAVGMPARVRRELTEQEREHIMVSSRHYQEYAAQCLTEQTEGPR
jgi:carbonic anhydrase/acetyltransferase-like protein (isoleucine patch superfamily)